MNKIFNIKRFGNYLLWDIRNAKNNFGLSYLLLGMTPLFLYVVFLIVCLIFDFDNISNFSVDSQAKLALAVTASTVLALALPVKQYGAVTEKKAGSSWLMVPASTLEKTLSSIILTCVIAPLGFAVLFLACDAIATLLPGYGSSLYGYLTTVSDRISEEMTVNGLEINMNAKLAGYLNWCEVILTFTLGAMFFKKSKTAKTILSVMGILILLSAISALIFGEIDFSNLTIDESKILFYINFVVSVIYIAVFAVLDLGLFFRIKKLTH